MKAMYCDICKDEITPGDTHYTARFVRNKWWNVKSSSIDICNKCHSIITDRKRAMERRGG